MATIQKCAQRIVYEEPICVDIPVNDLVRRTSGIYADHEEIRARTVSYSEGIIANCQNIKDVGQLINKINKCVKALDSRLESCQQELNEQIQERKELEEQVAQFIQETAQLRIKQKQMRQKVKSQQQRIVAQSEVCLDINQRIDKFKNEANDYNHQVEEFSEGVVQFYQEMTKMRKETTQIVNEEKEYYKQVSASLTEMNCFYVDAKTKVNKLHKSVDQIQHNNVDQMLYNTQLNALINRGGSYVDCLYKSEKLDEDHIKFLSEIEAFIPLAHEQDKILLNDIKITIEEMKNLNDKFSFIFSVLTLSFVFTIFQDTLPKFTQYLFSKPTNTHHYEKIKV